MFSWRVYRRRSDSRYYRLMKRATSWSKNGCWPKACGVMLDVRCSKVMGSAKCVWKTVLAGGFKYFLFSPLPREMIQFD